MYAGRYEFLPQNGVYFGRPAAVAARELVAEQGAKRVLIVSTPSLSRRTSAVNEISESLGPTCIDIFDDVIAHAPLPNILELANQIRAIKPDLLLTVGGGKRH